MSHIVAVEVSEVEVVSDWVEQRVGLDAHPSIAKGGRVRQVAVLIGAGGEEQAYQLEYANREKILSKSSIDFPVCILLELNFFI